MTTIRMTPVALRHNVNPSDPVNVFTIPDSAGHSFTITDLHLSSFGYFLVLVDMTGTGGSIQCSVGPGNTVNLPGLQHGPTSTFSGSDGQIRVWLFSPDFGLQQGTYAGVENLPAVNVYLAGELV